ncbi:MAG: hypothetical protein ABIY62_10415 [Ginsengibacter sp.]
MKNSVYHRELVVNIFFTGLMLFAQNIFAQAPSVKTSVDKTNILIGEQLHFRVSTSMPDNTYRLSWLNMPDTIGDFKVVKENKIDSSYANGNLNFSQDITLTSFDSGRHVIPSLALNVETLQGDSSFNLLTDSIPINVSFAPMDSTQTFHDIKSIIEVKKQWPWWAWALLALAVAILILWVRFLIKFFKNKKTVPGFFNAKFSPFDEAMNSLTELENAQLLRKDEVKEYHIRLTGIFKRYISRKTKTYKMYLTSDEILMDVNEYGLTKEQISSFANCLRMSNAVKFAKYIPPQNESENCFKQTREIISQINTNLNKKPESDI